MFRLFFALLCTGLVLLFAMDNVHFVPIGLVVGPPFEARLFFVLATAFLLGCLVTVLVRLYSGARKKGRPAPTATNRYDEDDQDDEDFFSR